jgi:hypothetical protein
MVAPQPRSAWPLPLERQLVPKLELLLLRSALLLLWRELLLAPVLLMRAPTWCS